ncbi:hypothetical protein D9M68_812270 [compost metagenome]
MAGAVGGGRRRNPCAQGDAGYAPHQAGVALEGGAFQRALGLQARRQLVDVGTRGTDVALELVVLHVTFHQHHPHPPLLEPLHRQEGVGQQVAVLLVAPRHAAGGFDQFREADVAADEGLVDRLELGEGVDAASLDLHFANPDASVQFQWLRLGGLRQSEGGGARPVGVRRKVGRG